MVAATHAFRAVLAVDSNLASLPAQRGGVGQQVAPDRQRARGLQNVGEIARRSVARKMQLKLFSKLKFKKIFLITIERDPI